MIQGKNIILSTITRKDISEMLKMRYSQEIRKNFRGIELPYYEEQEFWFNQIIGDKTKRYFISREIVSKKIVSILNYSSLNLLDRTANVGWYSPKSRTFGKNSSVSVILFLDYLFNEIGLRKLYSEVFSFNKNALDFNKKLGFITEGTLKEHVFKNNNYQDLILVALFRNSFHKLCKNILSKSK